jgi:hypothetical protein
MANPDDKHYEPVIVQLIEDSVVPDTQSVALVRALQFHHTWRAWLIGQTIDDWREPFPHVGRKPPEFDVGPQA